MKRTQGLLGRRIIRIQQSSTIISSGQKLMTLDFIELDDGTRLLPIAYQTIDEPIGDLVVNVMAKNRRVKAAATEEEQK